MVSGICSRCGITVRLNEKTGVLEPHGRFPTAAEYAIRSPHPMVQCEGSRTEDYRLPEWTKAAIHEALAEFPDHSD